MSDERLTRLGLSEKEQRFYRTVLELGSSPITTVATRAGITRTSGYDVLARLESRGLVNCQEISGIRHVIAADPRVLLTDWDQARIMLDDLVPELRAIYNGAHFKPRMHYHEGVEGIRRVLWRVLECRSPVLYGILSMSELLEVPGRDEMTRFIRERVKKGIELRVLRSANREVADVWPSSREERRELRFAPEGIDLGMTMFIHDDSVSYMSSKRENYAFSIESRELAILNRAFFQAIWHTAAPTHLDRKTWLKKSHE